MALQITNERGNRIPKELIGLFFEDINFGADGGLYAEMIENRSFEAKAGFGSPGTFYAVDDPGYAWMPYTAGGETPRLQYVTGTPLSPVNPHYLRFTATAPGQGFSNKAYDGIYLKKGLDYKVSFYARPVSFRGSGLTVQILKNGKTYASGRTALKPVCPNVPFYDIRSKDSFDNHWDEMIEEARAKDDDRHIRQSAWTRYELQLTAINSVEGAEFVITADGAGGIDFDLISMMPGDAVAGLFRKDLFEALKDLQPGFIRFPGGCIIEGISLDDRYRWKSTLGDVKDRRYIPNLWAFDDDRSKEKMGPDAKRPDNHYGESFGLGFYEYFLLCELLGAKPLPVLNIGAACQFRSTEIVPVDTSEFEEYVQDAVDLVEFANGPADSKWGSIRAKMGHPDPFGLDMIGIGNEQWETKYLDFYARYERFETAIHAKYPEVRLIGSAGPVLETPMAEEAWAFYRNSRSKKKNFCYAVDEHYYVSPEWMYSHAGMYDDYPDDVYVFAGEYAAHSADRENTMEAALSEAALLTGIEKNSRVVKLASYAPLFNRIGHSQWKPDMIWFDADKVFVTPTYQVQKMFSRNMGDAVIPMNGQEKELRKAGIYVCLSACDNGEVILKAVNTNAADYVLPLEEAGGDPVTGTAHLQVLRSAGPRPEGHPEPSVISRETQEMAGSVSLPAMSFAVIRF